MIVESSTPLTVDAHVHDTSDFTLELVKSSVCNQISKYSFATLLIEEEIEHETVDSSILHLMDHLGPLVLIMILWLFLVSHFLVSHQSTLL